MAPPRPPPVGPTGVEIFAGTTGPAAVKAPSVPAVATDKSLVVSLSPNNPVTITGSVTVTGGLTDAQLRATPVPVSGTVTANLGTVDGLALDATLTSGSQKTKLVDTGGVNVATISAAGAVKVDGSAVTQPISAAALPLPAGASTAALQTQPGVDIGDVTVNNAAGAAAVNIQDGGNSITVDGTVAISGSVAVTGPLTDTQLRATPVPVSGTVTTGGLTDTQLRASAVPVSLASTTITGSVAVTGPLTDTQLRASAVPVSLASTTITGTVAVSAAALPLPAGASTAANQTTLGSQTTKINDGTNTAAVKAAATTPLAADPALVVTISPNSPASAVSGTVTANQGTANTLANAWPIKQTDGTNVAPTGDVVARSVFNQISDATTGPVAVMPSSTAPVAADKALTVAISPMTPPGEAIELLISRTGLFHGKAASLVFVLGKRTLGWLNTTDQADVAGYLDGTQNNINAVATGTTYFVRSSSAADTAAGTGARTVRIISLDSSGVQQATTATLNGTTGVSLGSGFLYFQWMEVATVGTGGVAAGNITISTVAGAPTTAQTVEYLAAGGNRSWSGRYMVPLASTAFIINWSATASGGATQDVRLRSNTVTDTRAISTVVHFQSTMFLAAPQVADRLMSYLSFPALAEIKVSSITSLTATANRLDTGFKMIVVAD